MIIEKDKRYFRQFKMRLKPRTKFAPPLPLIAPPKEWSAIDAFRRAIRNEKASAPQADGGSIDLIKVEHLEKEKLLVLLFHKANPHAADPSYRKRKKDKLVLRQTAKDLDEEQAVSCHVILSTQIKESCYRVVLEEMPGLSATGVFSIIGRVLSDYKYPYTRNKESLETSTIMKLEGVKSETLTSALKKKGSLNYLILTKSVPSDVPDSSGIAEAQSERVKYKVVGDPSDGDWQKKFKDFVAGTKGTWDHVSVDITLEDDRHKTVRVDTEKEAAEVLFVRSELLYIGGDLKPCSMEVVPSIVKAGSTLIKKMA